MFFYEIKFLLPEIYLSFVIILLLISCICFDNLPSLHRYKLDFVRLHISIVILTLFFLALLIINTLNVEYLVINDLFYGNWGTSMVKLLLVFIFFSIFSSTIVYYRSNLQGYEFILLLLLALLAMMLIISSADLLTLFFSFEMLSLSVYVLTAYKRDSLFSTEAGLRYFILGAFISALFAFGISLIYYTVGSTNFVVIKLMGEFFGSELIDNTIFYYGFIFIFVAFLFKLSAFPFHFWTPDVYHGTSLLITKFLSTAPKLVMVTILIKLLGDVFHFYNEVTVYLLLISSLGSVLVGTLGGLFQTQIKRLLAYSTINNMGFVLAALAVGTVEGYSAAFFYTVVYILLSITIFSILLSFIRRDGQSLKDVSELAYLNVHRFVALIFAFTLFSLLGIPPLAGFFAKFYLFYPLLGQGFGYLIFFFVAMSIVSAGYYMRLVKIIFFENTDVFAFFKDFNRLALYIIVFTFYLNMGFLIFAQPLFDLFLLIVKAIIF